GALAHLAGSEDVAELPAAEGVVQIVVGLALHVGGRVGGHRAAGDIEPSFSHCHAATSADGWLKSHWGIQRPAARSPAPARADNGRGHCLFTALWLRSTVGSGDGGSGELLTQRCQCWPDRGVAHRRSLSCPSLAETPGFRNGEERVPRMANALMAAM